MHTQVLKTNLKKKRNKTLAGLELVRLDINEILKY